MTRCAISTPAWAVRTLPWLVVTRARARSPLAYLSWAKPYVESARDAAARGEVLTLDEHRARMAARLEAAKGA